jgi:hypothetical protein
MEQKFGLIRVCVLSWQQITYNMSVLVTGHTSIPFGKVYKISLGEARRGSQRSGCYEE